ncbi:hypothetical protein LguiA_018110 [Lonicera macranthoides]
MREWETFFAGDNGGALSIPFFTCGAARENEEKGAGCSLVINCGLSFIHVAPVLQNFTLNYGGKRLDLGGKALGNYLKELVSYRSVNLMDESFLMDDVKENLCFVLLDVARSLQVVRYS